MSLHRMMSKNTLARIECMGYTDYDSLSLDQIIPIHDIRGCTTMSYDDIVKPENDKKSYRRIELINEMQVLLISDPTTETSAAALDVGVGYMYDPINLQGLAHMIQHLLYSRSNDRSASYRFFTEVECHNGQIDARTTENNTTYYFAVNSDAFVKALGNFSGLFQFPAFDEWSHEPKINFKPDFKELMWEYRERHSAPLEKYWTTEITRTIKHTIDENHEFTKNAYRGFKYLWNLDFKTLVSIAKNFFKEYYSANVMTLCVYGREHLDVLEKCVSILFSQIRNFQEPRIAWIIPEFTSVYKIWCSVPENAPWLNYVIRIVFPMCGELTSSKNNALSHFISYLFQYEGKGSLITNLRKKKWATSVEAGELICPRGFSFFIVALSLTKKAYTHYFDEVMMLFLQYVRILDELSNPELRRIYNEYKEIMELKFRYQKQLPPLAMVCNRVRHIHFMDMDQVLRCDTISQHWLQHGVKHTLQNIFQPSLKLKIYLSHPFTSHENAVLKEYGRIPCKIKLVVPEEYSKWLNGPLQAKKLNAPLPNEFIPLRASIKPHKLDYLYDGEQKYLKYNERNIPEIIRDTPLMTTWYKRDTDFHVPRVSAYFHFICPVTYESDFNAHLTSLYVNIINTCLQEYKYPASLVDLRWKLSTTVRGIMIKINGFDDTVHVLLKKILGYLVMLPQNINFKLFLETFAYYNSNKCQKNKCKFDNLQPYEQAAYYLPYLLTEHAWMPHQVWKNDARISWEDFCEFLSIFIKYLHVECLFHGNITAVEALNMSTLVENIIRSKLMTVNPIPKENLQLNREIKLIDWSQYVLYREYLNHEHSGVLTFYQFNHRSTKSDVLLDLALVALQNITNIVDVIGIACGRHRGNTMQGLTIVFQCPNDVYQKCMKREINDFMMYTRRVVGELSDIKFEEIKQNVIETRQNLKTLHKMSDVYWNEILSQQHNFDRINSELQYLKTVTKKEFLKFYANYITEDTSRLSIYVMSKPFFEDSSDKIPWISDKCSCSPTCELTIINNIKPRFF